MYLRSTARVVMRSRSKSTEDGSPTAGKLKKKLSGVRLEDAPASASATTTHKPAVERHSSVTSTGSNSAVLLPPPEVQSIRYR